MGLGGQPDIAQTAILLIPRSNGEALLEKDQHPPVGGRDRHRRLGAEGGDGDVPPLFFGDEQEKKEVPGRIRKEVLAECPLPLPPVSEPSAGQGSLQREIAGCAVVHERTR